MARGHEARSFDPAVVDRPRERDVEQVAAGLHEQAEVARGGEAGVIYDIALWTVPFGLIGGRLYHLMTDWRTYFAEGGAGIGAAVRIWDGGLGIWGAVALGGVGAWIGCRRPGIPLPAFGDAIAPGIILAQAIGRLGNWFNQELFGRPTDLPWASIPNRLIIPNTDGVESASWPARTMLPMKSMTRCLARSVTAAGKSARSSSVT